MSGRKTTTTRKAERPPYENKAVVPPAVVRSPFVRVTVVKAHDGLQVGEEYSKPYDTAKMMQELGYWKIK